jgi:hypothetical protein
MAVKYAAEQRSKRGLQRQYVIFVKTRANMPATAIHEFN